MSIVSGTVGAVLSSQQQDKATRAQARQAEEYNALLRQLFSESRGSTGHAILPEYFGETERRAGDYAADIYDATRGIYGTPTDVARRAVAIRDRYQPLLDEGGKAIEGIYSGDLERKRLEAAKPVFAARRAGARSAAQAITESVLSRLAAIRAANSGRGFTGAGSAETNAALRTEIAGRQAAAEQLTAADIAEAIARQEIKNQILDLQLRGPELSGALSRAAAAQETLPAEIVGGVTRSQLLPFDYFKLGVGTPQRPEMAPWTQPNASVWQILANSTAKAGDTVGRYFLNRDLASRYSADSTVAAQNAAKAYYGNDWWKYYYGGGEGF